MSIPLISIEFFPFDVVRPAPVRRGSRSRNLASAFDEEKRKEDIKDLVIQGIEDYQRSDYQSAILNFRKVLAHDSNHFRSLSYMGASLHKVHRFAESIKMLNKAAQLRPDNPFVKKQIAEAYHQTGRFLRRL